MLIDHKKRPETEQSTKQNPNQASETDFSKRIKRYGKAKQGNTDMIAYLSSEREQLHPNSHLRRGYNKLISSMSDCGSSLLFHHYFTIGDTRLISAHTCKKHILCPFCAVRRSAKAVDVYYEKFQQILKENPNLRPYLFTLTVKNGHDFNERFDHLIKSKNTYMMKMRDAKRRGNGYVELNKMLGGFYSIENKKSDTGYHPHMHFVVLCDPNNLPDFDHTWPDHIKADSKLSKEWKKITGDSFIVDFRPIEKDKKDGFVSGFIEVLKYALKFSELTLEENYYLYEELKGKRLTGSFGLFWGVKIPEKLEDDPLDELPYIELLFKYSGNGKYNLQKNINDWSEVK